MEEIWKNNALRVRKCVIVANMKQITWLDFETGSIIKAQLSELQLGLCANCPTVDVSCESKVFCVYQDVKNPRLRDMHLPCLDCCAKIKA